MYIQRIRSSIEAVRDMDSSTLTYIMYIRCLGLKWREYHCIPMATSEETAIVR